jgi:Cd2+/Zn2+-exporting ATPase
MKQVTFHVAGMCCPTEEQLIRNRFKTIAGVDELSFNTMQQELRVKHELPDEQGLLSALNALGMEATLKGEKLATGRVEAKHTPHLARAVWITMSLSGVAAFLAEVIALVTGQETSPFVIGLAVLSIVVGGRDTLRKGFLALRTFTLNINFLMTVAIIGAVCIGQWPEAAMVTFLFAVAELVEDFSLDRARNAIRSLLELTPEVATVKDENGEWQEVEAAAVVVGTLVRVRPGERIPLDGTVKEGKSSVNQAPITGESIPVEKTLGDTVFAGTINERGSFDFEVTGSRGNTTLDRIVRAVQEAQSQQAPTQRFVDRFARYYTPAVVLLALLVAAVPPLFFAQPFSPWLYKALVMLVIACPCALVISTPVTVVSGLAAAARQGILIKGGIYLENGRKLRALALDKTGTITRGKPTVTDIVPLGSENEDTLLQLAASLDTLSEHPVASAIVAAWTGKTGSSGELLPVRDFEAIAGRGVRGTIEGILYFIGNHRLTEENKVCSPRVEAELARLEAEGKTAVVLTTEHDALALLGIADTLRDTSIEAIKELHALGIRTVMLTGDNQATAQAIATKVGIDDARGNLLPEEKLVAISDLQAQYGVVGMVGDGINDAPALAKAEIGFAMGAAGTDTAIETADVALMEDDLRKLPAFLRLSREAGNILVQNIAFAIGIKVIFFALAFAGKATLWMAVFADMGGSLLVVFNGLRLLRHGRAPIRKPEQCCSSECSTKCSTQ